MKKKLKKIPTFKNKQEEANFWLENDSTEYVDWDSAKTGIFSELKPTSKTISIRLPETMIENLKLLANKKDVPYQSLMKVFLADRIEKEFGVT